jgi:hypothetical protein
MEQAVAWTRDVFGQWRGWIRAHLGMTILLSVLAFGFGWIWNTYVMAVFLDGSRPADDERTIATAEGRPFNSLFWLLFFSLLSGFITYGWQRGWRNVWSDLAVLPRRFGETMKHDRRGAFAMLLWGMSVSLIISTVLSSAVSLALGLVLLTLSATPLGTILNFALIRLWRGLAGIVAPAAGMGAVLAAGPFLVMVGEALGLLLDWVFASLIIGLILGVVAAVVSVLLARGVSGTATAVLFGLTVGLPALLFAGRARADDGGWNECFTPAGEPCSDAGFAGVIAWFGTDGAGAVIANGALGGAFAGVGTAIGVGMGSVAASLAVAAAQASASGTGSSQRESAQNEQADWKTAARETQAETTETPTETPTVPQQPPAPPVEDFLPEQPDRKKDRKDRREGEGDQPQ